MVCLGRGGAGHYYEIDPAEPVLPLAETFPNQALDAIALVGFANLAFRDRQAKARIGFTIGSREQGQPAICGFERLRENPLELGGRSQAEGSGEPEAGGFQASDGQSLAPFGTAGIDDVPAIMGPHPGTKAVGPYALDLTGLIGSFHGIPACCSAYKKRRNAKAGAMRCQSCGWGRRCGIVSPPRKPTASFLSMCFSLQWFPIKRGIAP